jgi:hypothetical protein
VQAGPFITAVADLEYPAIVASRVEGFGQTVERGHRDVLETGSLG